MLHRLFPSHLAADYQAVYFSSTKICKSSIQTSSDSWRISYSWIGNWKKYLCQQVVWAKPFLWCFKGFALFPAGMKNSGWDLVLMTKLTSATKIYGKHQNREETGTLSRTNSLVHTTCLVTHACIHHIEETLTKPLQHFKLDIWFLQHWNCILHSIMK